MIAGIPPSSGLAAKWATIVINMCNNWWSVPPYCKMAVAKCVHCPLGVRSGATAHSQPYLIDISTLWPPWQHSLTHRCRCRPWATAEAAAGRSGGRRCTPAEVSKFIQLHVSGVSREINLRLVFNEPRFELQMASQSNQQVIPLEMRWSTDHSTSCSMRGGRKRQRQDQGYWRTFHCGGGWARELMPVQRPLLHSCTLVSFYQGFLICLCKISELQRWFRV